MAMTLDAAWPQQRQLATYERFPDCRRCGGSFNNWHAKLLQYLYNRHLTGFHTYKRLHGWRPSAHNCSISQLRWVKRSKRSKHTAEYKAQHRSYLEPDPAAVAELQHTLEPCLATFPVVLCELVAQYATTSPEQWVCQAIVHWVGSALGPKALPWNGFPTFDGTNRAGP
jgi:hypothetical protein